MGKITKWNDPAIAKINPGVSLPDDDITPCHRSDGSGTTYIFSDYLSKVSPDWAKGMGKSTSLKWTGGLGGKGNEGVTALLQQTPGAIGYIELIYALNNHIPFADIKNKEGNFVTASLNGVTAAGDAAARMSNRMRLAVNMQADFRRFDYRRSGRRFLSDIVVHLPARLSAANRQSQRAADHRFSQVGAARRPAICFRAAVCSAPGPGGRARGQADQGDSLAEIGLMPGREDSGLAQWIGFAGNETRAIAWRSSLQ